MTWPHQDPDDTAELRAKADKGLGCRSCSYFWWGEKFRWVCRHPGHPEEDGARLLHHALGCPDRVDRYEKKYREPLPNDR